MRGFQRCSRCLSVILLIVGISGPWARGQELVGTNVVPHTLSTAMRWRRPPDPELAARVELFVQNNTQLPFSLSQQSAVLFDDKTPAMLLDSSAWAWHDTPGVWSDSDVELPPDSLTVLSFNGQSAAWGMNTTHRLQLDSNLTELPFAIQQPQAWLSAVTFLVDEKSDSPTSQVFPDEVVVHIRNSGIRKLNVISARMWLPSSHGSHHVFHPGMELTQLSRFPSDGIIDGKSQGGFVVSVGTLPLTYGVVEVRVQFDQDPDPFSLWSHLRIKREAFDISGGWIAADVNGKNGLTLEEYLKTLQRMHVNTGQIEEVSGYTDNPELYSKFPFKRFNRLEDVDRYQAEDLLPTIHAVEFLGEPQYGGGKPVRPQEVWEKLAPYQTSQLPTTVTLSEERTWRYYAGLSDYPHFDAYRVVAPAADSWTQYDRWNGKSIRWGAPLETIGDMTRSLRELNRPRPIAYWSQGAHDGWGGWLSPRRSSPTPDELRSQAWHGLANRITSLYWFNLSLKSLVKFPDLIEPITRVNREIRLLERIFLEGDAFEYRRIDENDNCSWDLNSIASADSILLVAHDLAYTADDGSKEFKFQTRSAVLEFSLPKWLTGDLDVFRLDADGTHDVAHTLENGKAEITDEIHVVGMYIVTLDRRLRERMDAHTTSLIASEQSTGFDPGNVPEDLEKLRQLLNP